MPQLILPPKEAHLLPLWQRAREVHGTLNGSAENLLTAYRRIQKLLWEDTTDNDLAQLVAYLAERGVTIDDLQVVAIRTKALINALKPGTIVDTVPETL